jgi:undecaprenol kinase
MKRFLNSFVYAFSGFFTAVKTERNLKIHLVAAIIVIGLGVYLQLTALSWGIMIFAIGFVLTAELFNTAIEKICDSAIGEKPSLSVKRIKDISAAAVLITALTALVIGIIFLVIPFIEKMRS